MSLAAVLDGAAQLGLTLTETQATALIRLLDELDDPVSIHDFVSIAVESLVVDTGLTPERMISTAWTVRRIGIDALQTATVQSAPNVIGGAAVLVPSAADVAAAGDFLRAGTSMSASTGTAGAANSVDTGDGGQIPYELTGC